jgi:hypothetical protein
MVTITIRDFIPIIHQLKDNNLMKIEKLVVSIGDINKLLNNLYK